MHREPFRNVGLLFALTSCVLGFGMIASADDQDLAMLLRTAGEQFAAERERAREDLKRYTSKRDQARKITAAREWALSSFEAKERGIYNTPKALNSRMARAKKASESLRSYLLDYPNHPQTAMEIRKGRALNWFLAALGPTALDHELMRDKVSDQIFEAEAKLNELIAPPSQPVSPGERFESDADSEEYRKEQIVSLRNELSGLREYHKIITDQIGGRPVLTKSICRKIQFRVGESGTKYVMRNTNDSALPLRWPSVIRSNSYYNNACQMMESGRTLALAQLRDDGYIDQETQDLLFRTADAISREFKKDYTAHWKRKEGDAIKNTRYFQARAFVRGLRSSLVQFIQAEGIEDVQLDKPFEGERIEQLMAYMSRNGFQFAESEITSENAYRILYAEMVDYYVSMKNLQLSQQKAQSDESQWQSLVETSVTKLERDFRDDMRTIVRDATRPDTHFHLHYEDNSQTNNQ